MRFSIKVSELVRAIESVRWCAAKRSTNPILQQVLLSVEGSVLRVAANNNEQFASVTVDVESPIDGRWMVSHDKLIALLSIENKNAIATVSCDGSRLSIDTGRKAKIQLACADATAFPDVDATTGTAVEVRTADFLASLDSVKFCATTEDTGRWAIAGVEFSLVDGDLAFCATDTRRLATCGHSYKSKPTITAIVPMDFVNGLPAAFANVDEATVQISASQVCVKSRRLLLTTRTLEGNFPPHADLIKMFRKDAKQNVHLHREAFGNALRQAKVFSTTESVRVDMEFSDKGVTLKTVESGDGLFESSLDCKYEGKECSISFNAEYMLSFVKRSNSETFEFSFQPSKSLVAEVGNTTYLLMLMGG